MSAGEGGGGLAKCLFYYISLCSKLADRGGRGVKNWQNLADIVYGCPLKRIFLPKCICLKIILPMLKMFWPLKIIFKGGFRKFIAKVRFICTPVFEKLRSEFFENSDPDGGLGDGGQNIQKPANKIYGRSLSVGLIHTLFRIGYVQGEV